MLCTWKSVTFPGEVCVTETTVFNGVKQARISTCDVFDVVKQARISTCDVIFILN